jgi:hypothetical protein
VNNFPFVYPNPLFMVAVYSRPRSHKLFRSLQLRGMAPVVVSAATQPSPSTTTPFKPPSSMIAVASVTSVVGALVIISLGKTPGHCLFTTLADMVQVLHYGNAGPRDARKNQLLLWSIK